MALMTPAAAGKTASDVVTARLKSRDRDVFGQQRLREGRYTSGEIDVPNWKDEIEADYLEWFKTRR